MKDVKIGICKEGEMFRAYCGTDRGNIASAKATSRAESLVQLFNMLATEYTGLFYDGDPGDITLDE